MVTVKKCIVIFMCRFIPGNKEEPTCITIDPVNNEDLFSF